MTQNPAHSNSPTTEPVRHAAHGRRWAHGSGPAGHRPPGANSTGSVWSWVRPGLLAGAAFLLFEMLVGSFATTTWAFPEGIAHTIGIGPPGYAWQPWSLLAGVIVHLTVSVGLGVLFIVIARRLRLTGARLVAGAIVFSGVETGFTIWAVLHTLVSSRLPFLLGSTPFWASFVGHVGFGAVLGLLLLAGPFHAAATRN